jgi:hypothetical protein
MTDHFWLSQFDPINQMISLSAIKSSGFHLVPHFIQNLTRLKKKCFSINVAWGRPRKEKEGRRIDTEQG